jgi:hypothetical protein
LQADFPVLGKSDAKTDEPVEFVPRSDLGMILLAPQVVPDARVDVEVIHEAVRILVQIEDQARSANCVVKPLLVTSNPRGVM